MKYKIPFHIPFVPKNFYKNIELTFKDNKLYKGKYHDKCIDFFQKKMAYKNVVLTSSCTSALELVARGINLKKSDEIIVPSYTYVATANAFASFGAKIVFVDSEKNTPNISIESIIKNITSNTKAIVVVHYGGYAVDVQMLKKKINKNILIIEDAAHALSHEMHQNNIGKYGDFATISFHETKNITCGQGGALIINNKSYLEEILQIKEDGTNRIDFINGKVDTYTWQRIGTNCHINEITCKMLYSGLLYSKKITINRNKISQKYYKYLSNIKNIQFPTHSYIENSNGHIFYILVKDFNERNNLIEYAKKKGVQLNFHYHCLHQSDFYLQHHKYKKLPNAEEFKNRLIRLPLYYNMKEKDIRYVVNTIQQFYYDF